MTSVFVLIASGILMLATTGGGQSPSQDVNGGWTPWEVDPSIDCCAFGPFALYKRYCTNPTPERNGTKCKTENNTRASTEEAWRTCKCGCWPGCDNVTSFCSNDTGTGAYCQCNYGMVKLATADPNNITVCHWPSSTTQGPVAINLVTMSPDTKKTLNLAQYVSIGIMLACLVLCFVLMIFFYGFKPLRIIHMNQEICLAATFALIAFLVENTGDKTICMVVAILLHYLFMCAIVFFCLEALHTYSLVTYVVPTSGYLSTIINIALGYGVPIIPLAFSVGFLYDIYGNNGYHCWCDLDISGSSQAWAFLFPICFGAFACAVIAEAQGQGKYEPLPTIDESQYRSAKVSQNTIMITMPLATASYIIGLLAVDLQIVPAYYVFFFMTVLLGLAVLFAHVAASPKMVGICPCGSKNGSANHHGRVAPSPLPTPSKMQ